MLYPDFDEAKMEKGLSKAFLPGRFEITGNPFNKNDVLILDGAHTVNSVSFTMETLHKVFPQKKYSLLFGCASDKDVENIADFFEEEFTDVMLTRPGFVKSCDFQRMINAFMKKQISFECEENFTKAIKTALKKASEKETVLLVTGSFYLVCEVKKLLGTLFETPQVIS